MRQQHTPRLSTDERFWSKVAISDDCWAWTGLTDKDGYGKLRDADQRHVRAHVFAWWLATDEWPPTGWCVCHTCDIPGCIRNDGEGVYLLEGIEYRRMGHLWLGTNAANQRDKAVKGRTPVMNPAIRLRGDAQWAHRRPETVQGERNGFSKLTTEKVLRLREFAAEGIHYETLAKMFNISRSQAWKISVRQAWTHV